MFSSNSQGLFYLSAIWIFAWVTYTRNAAKTCMFRAKIDSNLGKYLKKNLKKKAVHKDLMKLTVVAAMWCFN